MSEKKLTVAELMARAGKEGESASTDAPRRRRRRSLDEGGVSVAELTGSLPAVKDKPAEARHSAIPIDAPEDEPQETPEAPAEDAAPASPVEPAEPTEADQPAEDADVDKQEEQSADTGPSADETMVISVVDEGDPIHLTTDSFPAVTTFPAVTAADKFSLEGKEAEPEEAAEVEAPVEDEKPNAAETNVIPEVTEEHIEAAEDTTTVVEETPAEELTEEPEFDEQPSEAADEDQDEESGGKISVAAVILMAIIGVIVGVAVFLAFEILWGRLNNGLVAVLAIAVTAGLVGIVHVLRTSRDGLSMGLAALVGLVMTFGPLLIVGF